jgi:hypothetical protein
MGAAFRRLGLLLLRERRETVENMAWQLDDLLIDAVGRADAGIGTGDGRYLAGLLAQVAHWPRLACATEAYRPNVPLARDRLTGLHVSVVEVDSTTRHPSQGHLPVAGGAFDLVMRPHDEYAADEVARVLRSGGAGANGCGAIPRPIKARSHHATGFPGHGSSRASG